MSACALTSFRSAETMGQLAEMEDASRPEIPTEGVALTPLPSAEAVRLFGRGATTPAKVELLIEILRALLEISEEIGL